MKFSLSTPKQRILAAIAVSLIAHALLLWLPHIDLPVFEPSLPPLMAKLQPLSRAAPLKAKKPNKKATPAAEKPVAPPATEAPAPEPEPIAMSSVVASSSVAEASTVDAASAVAAATPASGVNATTTTDKLVVADSPASPPRPPLPKHARLKFEIRVGTDGMVVGQAVHTLDFEDNRYDLHSTTKTTGLAWLVKSYTLNQSSWGESDGQLLSPRKYTEEKVDEHGTQTNSATFDRDAKKLIFDNGKELALIAGSQDMLSILYQFPPLPAEGDVLPISVTNARGLDQYRFEITTDELLITPMGKLHTVHFRKQRPAGKEGLEIWFAQEYRLLPVKVRHIEPSGKIGGEAIITEIRLSDK